MHMIRELLPADERERLSIAPHADPDKIGGSVAAFHHSRRSRLDDLSLLRSFMAVATTGNFSRAGRLLNVTPSTISKHISALETKLNGQLVLRTTTQLSFTELGHRFQERCATILNEVALADAELEDYLGEPQGTLRLSVNSILARKVVTKLVKDFLLEYPRLKVELSQHGEEMDLVRDGIDLAILDHKNVDSELFVTKLYKSALVHCATAEYLALYGFPRTIDDLVHHNCLTIGNGDRPANWTFRLSDDTLKTIPVKGNVTCTDNEMLRDALLSGVGIGQIALPTVYSDLQAGDLIELFPDNRAGEENIYAIYFQPKHLPLKTRLFLDYLKAEYPKRQAREVSSNPLHSFDTWRH